jgi:hypothetical protein
VLAYFSPRTLRIYGDRKFGERDRAWSIEEYEPEVYCAEALSR